MALRTFLLAALTLSLSGCASLVRSKIYRIYPASTVAQSWTGGAPRPVEASTSDGLTLKGLFWPPADGRSDVAVFFHGNAGELSSAASMAEPLRRGGRGVLVASYRGYSGNPGHPTERNLTLDGAAFVALARKLITRAQVYPVGYSLGAAVAIRQATISSVAGVVVIGAFTRLSAVTPLYARPFLPDVFDNVAAISRVSAPVIVVHGSADEVVPLEQGCALWRHVPNPRNFIVVRQAEHHFDLALIADSVWGDLAGADTRVNRTDYRRYCRRAAVAALPGVDVTKPPAGPRRPG